MTGFYQFQKQFPDDEACLRHIMKVRYGGTVLDCPKCGKQGKFYRMTKERGYVCEHCGHHLHPTVGTPMERTHLPLHKWFYAMFLFTTSRHGVSAKELQRQLDISYKSAWRMGHVIRQYMAKVDGDGTLDGIVELDEAYIGGRAVGGKKKGLTGRGTKKAIVFGMLEREGEVITRVVEAAGRRDLFPHVRAHVAPGSHISTDEWMPYRALPKMGYSHGTVEHRSKEYVRGIDHVNNLEAFWLILKRSIRGTHVWVSKKHLSKYLGEFEFRYNRRKRPASMFAELVASL
ncbi:MAG: IS1595 family transposase [Rhodospirillaceae bacterium]|nr:IS1595 family transposase [Rhodospirillaceae bacterium]MDE0619315.1 IS1595 family transposase [Rhodospirillaceae bacterium]